MSKDSEDGSGLRSLMKKERILVVPGVFNPIAARIAEKTGFRALYFSGGALSNQLGLPDLGVTTLSEVVLEVRRIKAVSRVPLIVDADTGFGETVNVQRAVVELEKAGAAAIHIEDQVFPKRCGQLDGKLVVPIDEMVKKLVAADEARDSLLLIARTDARAVEGLDAAVERGRLYMKAGADIIFPEALESEQEFMEFAKKVDAPLLANMTEFGKTPYISAERFAELGYKMVIFPMTAFRGALKAVKEVYDTLKMEGSQKGMIDRLMSREEVYALIDYYKYQEADNQTLAKAKKLIEGLGHQ